MDILAQSLTGNNKECQNYCVMQKKFILTFKELMVCAKLNYSSVILQITIQIIVDRIYTRIVEPKD